MFFPESTVRIWLYRPPVDARKSFNGLSALVKTQLQENPLDGAFYVFLNRRKTLMKILFFDRTGYCIWYKKLEQGVFQLPQAKQQKVDIDYTQLKLMLEGIDFTKIHQRKRYKH